MSYFKEFLGRYVVVHTGMAVVDGARHGLPGSAIGAAYFGYALDYQDGVILLADSALWTRGMTKDLFRPGAPMTDHTDLPWRLGLAATCPIAVQEVGYPGESGRGAHFPLQGAVDGLSTEAMLAVRKAYETPRTAEKGGLSNCQSLDIAGTVAAVGDMLPSVPRRVAASIILHAMALK